ncbi:hypothetical protein SALB1_2012 [Salinisphaera sp. LB1]|nr:hypothetical protein SALB1_2012 [Salinisphaera sp. LB1]
MASVGGLKPGRSVPRVPCGGHSPCLARHAQSLEIRDVN